MRAWVRFVICVFTCSILYNMAAFGLNGPWHGALAGGLISITLMAAIDPFKETS